MTSDADRRLLLHIAREALTAHVCGRPIVDAAPTAGVVRLAGVFVTLTESGVLRGCIGHVEPTVPLCHLVAHCAVAAGSSDPRFPAVTPSELAALDIEVSILGPFEPIGEIDEIELGRHGLMVELGRRRGLLLPQVAIEQRWDRQTFVIETCRKAGVPSSRWRRAGCLWRFEAEVFGERATADGDWRAPAPGAIAGSSDS
jgi:AmmeMemoRadiSam system protein A